MGIQQSIVTVKCDNCEGEENFSDITFENEIYERIYDNGWITVESAAHGQSINPSSTIFTTFYCSPECLPFPQSSIVKDKDGKIATFNSIAFSTGESSWNLLFMRYLKRIESELPPA